MYNRRSYCFLAIRTSVAMTTIATVEMRSPKASCRALGRLLNGHEVHDPQDRKQSRHENPNDRTKHQDAFCHERLVSSSA